MTLLKHQIILHPDIVGQFALDKPITPYERHVGFSWYLCPVAVAGEQGWLLVNVEFGYCELVVEHSKTAADIEAAVLDVIEYHPPDDREEDNVSVSFDPVDITWHIADKMPEHVGLRYQQALKRLRKCKDISDAEDALESLNDTPLTIGGRTFAPTEGLEGLLKELADNFKHYIETTPWWKVRWHLRTKKTPSVGLGNEGVDTS